MKVPVTSLEVSPDLTVDLQKYCVKCYIGNRLPVMWQKSSFIHAKVDIWLMHGSVVVSVVGSRNKSS